MPKTKCSAKDCTTNGMPSQSTTPMFKFPRDLDRCATWVKNSGNDKLLQTPSRRLFVRKYLCSQHFDENQFFDKFHRRLRRHAIPTKFSCEPLSNKTMAKFPVPESGESDRPTYLEERPNRSTLSSLLNIYNSFLIPCPRECRTTKYKQSLPREVKVATTYPEKSMSQQSDMPGFGLDVCQEEEHLPSVIKIPCESSVNDIETLLPETRSITYIQGPWSSSSDNNQPFSVEISNDINSELTSGRSDDGRYLDFYSKQNVQNIIVHHIEMKNDEEVDLTEDLPLPQSLKISSLGTKAATGLPSFNVLISDCE